MIASLSLCASFYLQEEEEMNSLVPILHSSQITTIDVTQLHHDSHTKPLVVKSIHDACQKMGFFQVPNMIELHVNFRLLFIYINK